MTYQRTAILDFAIENRAYANALVSAWKVDANNQKTNVRATLYQDLTSGITLPNPQKLGSRGAFQQPVYIEEPVILTVAGLAFAESHDTGVIYPRIDVDTVTPEGFENVLLNPAFSRWTRGTSRTGAGYLADAWYWSSNGAGGTHTRQEFPIGQTEVPQGGRYFSRIEYANAPAGLIKYLQRVENVYRFDDTTLAVDFYARAPVGVANISDFTVRLSQFFGTGGLASGRNLVDNTVQLTDGWQYYFFVVNLPSIAGETVDGDHYLELDFRITANGAFTWDIARPKVQFGSVAGSFALRPPAVEAELCRRYFRRQSVARDVADLAYEMYKQPTQTGSGPYDYDAELVG
jgi:hypothetical protein